MRWWALWVLQLLLVPSRSPVLPFLVVGFQIVVGQDKPVSLNRYLTRPPHSQESLNAVLTIVCSLLLQPYVVLCEVFTENLCQILVQFQISRSQLNIFLCNFGLNFLENYSFDLSGIFCTYSLDAC